MVRERDKEKPACASEAGTGNDWENEAAIGSVVAGNNACWWKKGPIASRRTADQGGYRKRCDATCRQETGGGAVAWRTESTGTWEKSCKSKKKGRRREERKGTERRNNGLDCGRRGGDAAGRRGVEGGWTGGRAVRSRRFGGVLFKASGALPVASWRFRGDGECGVCRRCSDGLAQGRRSQEGRDQGSYTSDQLDLFLCRRTTVSHDNGTRIEIRNKSGLLLVSVAAGGACRQHPISCGRYLPVGPALLLREAACARGGALAAPPQPVRP